MRTDKQAEQFTAAQRAASNARRTGKAQIANYPRRLTVKLDQRSFAGRRFGELFDLIKEEFPEAHAVRIREIATLRLAVEEALAARDITNVVRLMTRVERSETRLRAAQAKAAAVAKAERARRLAQSKAKATPGALADYLKAQSP